MESTYGNFSGKKIFVISWWSYLSSRDIRKHSVAMKDNSLSRFRDSLDYTTLR